MEERYGDPTPTPRQGVAGGGFNRHFRDGHSSVTHKRHTLGVPAQSGKEGFSLGL